MQFHLLPSLFALQYNHEDTESWQAPNNRSTQCMYLTPYHNRCLAHAHVLPLTHKQSHHYSLTTCVCPEKGAMEKEQKSKLWNAKWQTHDEFHLYPLTCFKIRYCPNLLSIPTSFYHLTRNSLQYHLEQCNFTYLPHYLLCITNMKTLNHDRHTTIDLLDQSHHYSLTSCVCPEKGAIEEEKKSKLWNFKWRVTPHN